MKMDSSFLLEKQVSFCGHPNITLLNFDDYENSIRFVLEEFGLDPTVEIPHLNKVDKENYTLNPTDVDKIKSLYKEDYDFFESMNITF